MASSTGSEASSPGLSPSTPRTPRIPTIEEVDEWETTNAHTTARRRSIVDMMKMRVNTRAEDKSADNLLPIHSPVVQREQTAPEKSYLPGQPKSLEGIALRSFCLGGALALSIVTMGLVLALTSSPLWRLPFFVGALSTFHFFEFWTTAKYNTPEAKVSTFLLTANWPAYAIAHTAALLECLITQLAFPRWHWGLPVYVAYAVMFLGLVLVAGGQFVRSTAMVQAGPSFNHIVQHRKRDSHSLVTTGIYGALRHPSYFGFFWWGLGTQLVLGNSLCLVGYAAVLWKFFSSRIKHEEAHLIRFFGDDYVDYKKKVPTMIPFIQ